MVALAFPDSAPEGQWARHAQATAEARVRWGRGGGAGSIFDSLNQKEQAPWKKRLAYHLEGLPATILVTAVTFVALFLDDARLALLPPAADVVCQVLSGISMARPPIKLLLPLATNELQSMRAEPVPWHCCHLPGRIQHQHGALCTSVH